MLGLQWESEELLPLAPGQRTNSISFSGGERSNGGQELILPLLLYILLYLDFTSSAASALNAIQWGQGTMNRKMHQMTISCSSHLTPGSGGTLPPLLCL